MSDKRPAERSYTGAQDRQARSTPVPTAFHALVSSTASNPSLSDALSPT